MNEKTMRKQKWQPTILLVIIILLTYFSSWITQFEFMEGIMAVPNALYWMGANLLITAETFDNFPKIIEELMETILMSIAATTIAAVVSFFLSLQGSKLTRVNKILGALARAIASFSRNVPVVAWTLILLISFGQNSLTGFFALFIGTVGFLTRAFMEIIDEASQSSVEALTSTGATYFQIVSKGVLPQSLAQMISWVLFMIETNIRSATLVGILTGTGIGYMFDMYYKMLDYNTVALITMTIVLTVIFIEMTSNYVRKVIL